MARIQALLRRSFIVLGILLDKLEFIEQFRRH